MKLDVGVIRNSEHVHSQLLPRCLAHAAVGFQHPQACHARAANCPSGLTPEMTARYQPAYINLYLNQNLVFPINPERFDMSCHLSPYPEKHTLTQAKLLREVKVLSCILRRNDIQLKHST